MDQSANSGADNNTQNGEQVQKILEKLVTHLLIKKPEEPVSYFDLPYLIMVGFN